MSDWLLLYLFTQLDSLKSIIAGLGVVLLVISILGMAAVFALANEKPLDRLTVKQQDALLMAAAALSAIAAMLVALSTLTPSQKDMAIIVGGSMALEASRSDDAKELAGDVMAAIRAKLKEAAE